MKIRKAVFPAAGFGTRFLPATKSSPKEMLPIVDTPVIHLAVSEALAAGLEEMIIVTGRGKQAIENYFDKAFELEYQLLKTGKKELLQKIRDITKKTQFVYVRQKEMKGLGDAILTAKNLVGDEPFAVILADDVIFSKKPALKQMTEIFNKKQCSCVAVMEVDKKDVSSYGIIEPREKLETRLFDIKNMEEKPLPKNAKSNLGIVGRYILTPKIFELLENTKPGAKGEIQITDAINKLLNFEKVLGYRFEGARFDTGDKLGFVKATIYEALKRKTLSGPLKKYLKEIL